MAIRPTISAYGGGTQQFPVFLNKAFVGYQFEKTERDLMRTINSNVARSQQKRINILAADGTEIPNVVGARRMPGSGIRFASNTIGDGSYGGSVTGDSGT